MSQSNWLTVIVMAAGASRRFGSPKQLASIENTTLIQHCLERLKVLPARDFVLTLGANAQKIRPYVNDNLYRSIEVINWQGGLGNSIAEAVTHIDAQTTHILIALADQVDIPPCAFEKLLEQAKTYSNQIIASQYLGKLGVPAIFPVRYLPELKSLSGDKGARDLIHSERESVISVELHQAATDIDTEAELQQWLNAKQVKGPEHD